MRVGEEDFDGFRGFRRLSHVYTSLPETSGRAPVQQDASERMTSEESRQAGRHRAWILHMQQVCRVGESESLDLRQPGEQKFLSLAPDRRDLRTLSSQDGEDWLFDADRVLPRERPLSHCR